MTNGLVAVGLGVGVSGGSSGLQAGNKTINPKKIAPKILRGLA
jgi:hypothetical protein